MLVSVRLCLPFPCVSTPIYGPSCFLSLVHSSPSVFDLCYVFISPEFSLSLCPSTRLCSCVSCVVPLNSVYLPYLSSSASFPLHDRDSIIKINNCVWVFFWRKKWSQVWNNTWVNKLWQNVPFWVNSCVNEFVSSSKQIWRNLALHHLLTNGFSAVNGCLQNGSPN